MAFRKHLFHNFNIISVYFIEQVKIIELTCFELVVKLIFEAFSPMTDNTKFANMSAYETKNDTKSNNSSLFIF